MLDDLKPIGEVIHRTMPRSVEPVTAFILEIQEMYAPDTYHLSHGDDASYNARCAIAVDDMKSGERKVPERKHDPSYFWSHLYAKTVSPPLPFLEPVKRGAAKVREMAESIVRDGYFCENRVNKYYAIAFAVNEGRFYVYSKDCPPQLLSWHKHPNPTDKDELTATFLGAKPPDEVNDGPVVALMRALHSH